MPKTPTLVTAAEISRLAGVTRATVSNWRRRHPDFPAPAGGTEASPAYDVAEVRAWLAASPASRSFACTSSSFCDAAVNWAMICSALKESSPNSSAGCGYRA